MNGLFVRLTRDKFCSTLDRFWTRFSQSWDVLLHGNPAVDVFGGIKLASGGELGFGVGEEEWGSGEREVLEDLTHRTEGLVDVVVSRFGETAPVEDEGVQGQGALSWIGGGNQPLASDGVIFGGIGAIERRSLRNLSLWIRQIYTYGDYAYGVRDNPLREPRKRRRRNPLEHPIHANGKAGKSTAASRSPKSTTLLQSVQRKEAAKQKAAKNCSDIELPAHKRPEIDPRAASHDYTTIPKETPTSPTDDSRPNVPPPMVSAVEQALQKATREAEIGAQREQEDTEDAEDSATTLGIPDQYVKYLTFGLSTLGKPAPRKRPPASRQSSNVASKTPQIQDRDNTSKQRKPTEPDEVEENAPMMTSIKPIPDGETLKSKIATQKRQENKGYFVIGLKGDLAELDDIDDLPEDDDDVDITDGSFRHRSGGSRIILRTIQIEPVPTSTDKDGYNDILPSEESSTAGTEPINEAYRNFVRMRVLVYVHRPFVYCFLFEDRTSSLQWTGFYKSLHRSLLPIHRPLLSSTSAVKVTQRIQESQRTSAESESVSVSSRSRLTSKDAKSTPIFDLVYDPKLLTLHTSIPNIPEPGTSAAEGILTSFGNDAGSQPAWTRIDAINVHSQILNTLASVKSRNHEIERMSKTSRGWWVVWMKVRPIALASAQARDDSEVETETSAMASDSDIKGDNADEFTPAIQLAQRGEGNMHRIAFLVRKASDSSTASKSSSSSSRAVSSMFGNMSLGLGTKEDEKSSGLSAGWGPGALTGGIGVDARRYVEGLLSLNR